MALIDEIKFYAEAGKGGDGVIRWRQEKFVPKGGPAGGGVADARPSDEDGTVDVFD
jgi:GTPase involved in cell partitioning and DNA repair